MNKETVSIFLDIDGVLNDNFKTLDTNYYTEEFYKKHGCNDQISYILANTKIDNINNFRKLLDFIKKDGYDIDIIISSSWRYVLSIPDFIKLFEIHKLNIYVNDISKTYTGYDLDRHEEIAKYIVENNVNNFIILDDEFEKTLKPIFNEHFIKCEMYEGFSCDILKDLINTKIWRVKI